MPLEKNLALALCIHGAFAMAQVPVEVGDPDSKPVPYAHMAWQSLASDDHGLVVMDAQGKGMVPMDRTMTQKGVVPGYPLSHHYPGMENVLLLSCTEANNRTQIDKLAEIMGGLL